MSQLGLLITSGDKGKRKNDPWAGRGMQLYLGSDKGWETAVPVTYRWGTWTRRHIWSLSPRSQPRRSIRAPENHNENRVGIGWLEL